MVFSLAEHPFFKRTDDDDHLFGFSRHDSNIRISATTTSTMSSHPAIMPSFLTKESDNKKQYY
jgi:hypothetical protein